MATAGHTRVRSDPNWNQRLRKLWPTSSPHKRVQSLSTASSPSTSTRLDVGLRSQSVPSFADMATTLAPTPVPNPAFPLNHSDHDMMSPITDTPTSPILDAGTEVTALSNKLIAAINYQTSLDDSLAAARQELDHERDRAWKLEASNKEYQEMMQNGTLVKRADIESENVELKEALEEERQKRTTVEKERKSIEQELENLTTALFEEANQMVAAARHERDLTERKNEQLRGQLKDTENLLASHQEQLAELKAVMQQMSSDRDENETNTNQSTAPTTPLLGTHEHLNKLFDALHLCPNTPGSDDIPPSYPTSFTHLLQPVLRADLSAYQDFSSLLKTSRTPQAARNRSSTGTYSGLSLSLGSLRESSPWHTSSTSSPVPSSNGSSPSTLPTNTSLASSASPATPQTPTASQGNALPKDVVPLKDTRFYKRVLIEDIEPTLRLDIAPGLSWLARRNVAASMSEGNLVVEPLPPAPSIRVVTCALCGERRRGEQYARTHQLKANENETAQRYPLCKYCTGRVRATCDFLGFLRMIKDGHWRADGEEGEKSAWEESVRLRDRMFWARIGGGVVPAFVQIKESSRPSSAESEGEKKSAREGNADEAKTSSESVQVEGKDEDIFRSTEKRVSIGSTVICVESKPSTEEKAVGDEDGDATGEELAKSNDSQPVTSEEGKPASAAPITLDGSSSPPPPAESTGRAPEQRLSITIPGAFEETETP
ncbi:MAG: hypothetical protein M1823_002811 [Watsoniomyces obsoletus]|nr:MAG: hypothetical protein M1823_002811 [Watsoniomyces obsoletus]